MRRSKHFFSYAFVLAMLAGAMVHTTFASTARAQERIIIILDSSGSMVGRISGQRKIDIARSAVRSLIGKMQPDIKLGFVAYGHRRKGDCADIETIYEIGNLDVGRISRAMDKLKPIGKTPLGAAVRLAAEKLRYTEEKATVILVSDGKENCGVDPCALGRDLKAKGIDFRTHVVGFNIKKSEEAGLKCLATTTGGLYVKAKDAGSLEKAMQRTVKAAAQSQQRTLPPPVKVPTGIVGLKVNVLVKTGGPAWKNDIALTLFDPKVGLDGKRKKIHNAWRKRSGHFFKNLPARKYLLRVGLPDHRYIAKEVAIEVKGGAANVVTVVLDIGQVRFDASLKEGGKPFKWDLGWTVLALKKDFAGKRRKLTGFWRKKSGAVYWLPAGKWRIEGVLADARYIRVAKEISVEAGGGEAHAFNLNAGLVRFDAKLSEEGKPFKGSLGWTVLSAKTDLSGKRRKLAGFWRVRSGKIFVLPAGKWIVQGLFPDHRQVTVERTIEVAPASEELHTFVFNAGTVRFDATVGGQPTSGQLGLTVFAAKQDLAGKRRKIASFWRVKSGRISLLPAGKYVLQGMLADQRKTTGQVAFEVAADEEKIVSVDLRPK